MECLAVLSIYVLVYFLNSEGENMSTSEETICMKLIRYLGKMGNSLGQVPAFVLQRKRSLHNEDILRHLEPLQWLWILVQNEVCALCR